MSGQSNEQKVNTGSEGIVYATTELAVLIGTEVHSSSSCIVEPLINTSALARLTIST